MGKNKRAAKAAWRAAAAASIAASTTSPAPSLVARVAAHDAPTAIDTKEPTPAPTQPRDVPAQNARLAPRTSSLASNTTSASPSNTPTSRSQPAPPFSTESEPERRPIPTTREPRETRNERPQPVPPTTLPASHMHAATPHDSRTPPDHALRPSAAETALKESSGPRGDKVRTESNAHGGHPHPVRTPTPPASRTRAATVHDIPIPRDDPKTPFASEREPAACPAPTTASPTSHTTTHDRHDAPASPTATMNHHAATNEPNERREARGYDTHNASSTSVRTAPHTASPASQTRTATPPEIPAPAHNGATPPTPGIEPGEPHTAAASFLKYIDPKLLEPARLEEIVAIALREGHAEGLKEGRNVGFRLGLEAGKRAGVREGRESQADTASAGHSPIVPPLEADPRMFDDLLDGPQMCARHIWDLHPDLLQGILEQGKKRGRKEGREEGEADGFRAGLRAGEIEGRQRGFREGKVAGLEEGRQEGRSEVRRPQCTTIAVQTDEAPTLNHVDSTVQTEPVLTTSRTSLSWADDFDSLPIPGVSSPCLPAPRDFSVLRSDFATRPFGSLQRRARRSHRTRSFVPRPHIPWPAPPSLPIVTHCHPAGLRAGRPSILRVSSSPSGFAVPPLPLSWDGDPRLVELSRVLRSLGWVRESSG